MACEILNGTKKKDEIKLGMGPRYKRLEGTSRKPQPCTTSRLRVSKDDLSSLEVGATFAVVDMPDVRPNSKALQLLVLFAEAGNMIHVG